MMQTAGKYELFKSQSSDFCYIMETGSFNQYLPPALITDPLGEADAVNWLSL